MTDDNTRDELAQLRARVAQLETKQRPRSRLRQLRRFLPLAVVGLLVALMPLSLLAATPFLDLDQTQNGPTGHNPNIDAIFNAGITKGCTATEYCPKDVVTREQMASFLARTAGLGNNAPVTNAKTLSGLAGGGLIRVGISPAATGAIPFIAPAVVPIFTLPVAVAPLTAPAAGYVLANASATFTFDASCINCTVLATLGDATFSANQTTGNVVHIALTYATPISAAGAAGVPLIVQVSGHPVNPAPNAPPNIFGTVTKAHVSALYTPFGADGAAATAQP